MSGFERRKKLLQHLKDAEEPLSGSYLSRLLNVSRQAVVQDIAILRAEGHEIIATPQGYIIPRYPSVSEEKRIIACSHDRSGIEDELKTIISLGGRVIDVVVEHPVYGEIKGMLMLSSIYDVDMFIKKLGESEGQPLLVLTGGVHLHTIAADSQKKISMIEEALRNKKYLVDKNT